MIGFFFCTFLVKIKIIMQLIFVENLTKKIGSVPKSNPIVVRPKAKPGVLFKTDTSIPKVIGIVKLNNKTRRQITYKADFTYFSNEDNKIHVIDVKGFKTDVYNIKKKMFEYKYGIEIEEI